MIGPMTSQEILWLSAARTHAETGSGRTIRLRAKLSMAEVAMAVGVAEPTIWRWEGGKSRPRGKAAIRWGALLSELSAVKKTAA